MSVDQALFFEGLRDAAARLPAGLVRLAPPAGEAAIDAAATALGRPLPHAYLELLRSFDGADLFHESILVCGVDRQAFRSLLEANRTPAAALRRADEIAIAETPGGDLYLLAEDGRVWQLAADGEERWLAGSSFPRWIDATLAREQILYDAEGEFLLQAFEPDGEELTATYALRQAERALRRDPGAALRQHDLGVALRRAGRLDRARAAFAEAAALDPDNPWPWFDLGRADPDLGAAARAAEAFRSAAAAEGAAAADRGRLLAWTARAYAEAGDRAAATAVRAEAVRLDPALPEALRRAAEAAEDPAARAEADGLAAVFSEGAPVRRRLPVIGGAGPVGRPVKSAEAPGRRTKGRSPRRRG